MPQSSPNTLVLPVAGMTCAACVYHVGEALRSVDGVTEVSVNLATERATISLGDADVAGAPDMETLAKAVADAGYRLDTNPQTADGDRGAGPRAQEEQRLRIRLIVAALGGGALLLGSFPALPWTPGLLTLWWYPLLLWAAATPVQLWAGWSFYTAGVVVVLTTLLAPGALGSTGAHQLHFDMAAIIVALILLGRWLEARALSRTSGAIERLLDLRPQTAHLMAADGSISDVPVDHVEPGDTLAVRPGEQLPVDGEVASGATNVDQSALTGESMPAEKSAGDPVFAGTLNGNGAILMRATRVGLDTTLSQVIRLVEEAQGSAAPVQRLADRVAAWFVPAVGLIALAAAIFCGCSSGPTRRCGTRC
ncbi:Copper-exporting P-type ATPase [Geodia barretti]|uniref:Copper-exporting P-type ATPase n=1 Tax=Geodia barretti TaxID=519541 RepID=A0AA35REK5_GEOBA|nr:Copper-exporting P-type ATPase [Geodia barretti]